MAARLSIARFLSASALGGPTRVSNTRFLSATALIGPIRVTEFVMLVAQTHNRAIFLNRLESTSSVDKFDGYGPKSFTVSVLAVPTPEHNPYRPTIPESVIDTAGAETYDYLKENQEILREQHNLIQAGDTTFPYEMMVKAHDEKHYNLGSIARFYHADYGVILARYVQFSNMLETGFTSAPCGFLHTKKSTTLRWIVTNNIAKSHADLAVGVLGTFELPSEGQFGWLVIDGPNLQQVGNDSVDGILGETLSWSSNGKLSNTGKGRMLARRIYKPAATVNLYTGYLHIEVESWSQGGLVDLINATTKQLQSDVVNLQQDVDGLSISASPEKIAAILAQIKNLAQKLNLESGARVSGDKSLSQRIDGLSSVNQTTLDNAILELKNLLENENLELAALIQAVKLIAQEAITLANQVTPAQIQELYMLIDELNQRFITFKNQPHGKFPVVDGAIPPNLVYLDDGSLVFTETF